MAPLYVYALTSSPVKAWTEERRTIESVRIGEIFAVGERRPAPPPLTEEELQRQHSIVLRIADAAPAVLPARFGSLVDDLELEAIVRRRAEAFRAALDLVRGNAQMTIRVAVKAPAGMRGGAPESGKAYLQQRFKRASPVLPARVNASLGAVRPFVLDERRTFSDAGMVTVYQLVGRGDVDEYKKRFEGVPGIQVTGPWPPFAFVPELWS